MKSSPYHIELVTCEDEVGCTILSQAFMQAIFLKVEEEGQHSVQAETFYSNGLTSVTLKLSR